MCWQLRAVLGVNFGSESQFIVRYYRRLAQYGDLTDDRRLRRLMEDIGEERFFVRSGRNFGFVFDVDRAMRDIPSRTYAGVLRAIFDQFAAMRGLSRWGDKTPEYSLDLPVIAELFPEAQYVHMVRDPRDVTASVFKTGFGPKTAYEAGTDWRDTVMRIRRFQAGLPRQRFHEVRYEDLLADPVSTLGAVAAFLGIANAAELVDARAAVLRRQIRADNRAKWRHELSAREVECIDALAGEALTVFGYAPVALHPRKPGALQTAAWIVQGVVRRATNTKYWADNWYKLRLRARGASLSIGRRLGW